MEFQNQKNIIKMEKGDLLRCVFTELLPGKNVAPQLSKNEKYLLEDIFTDSAGNQHFDVGLKMDVEEIHSFATGELLPPNIRWCHPNRFVIFR
jgi:hypothetical protein